MDRPSVLAASSIRPASTATTSADALRRCTGVAKLTAIDSAAPPVGGASLKSPPRSACRSRPALRSPLPRWLARSTLAVAHFRLAPTSSASISVTDRLSPSGIPIDRVHDQKPYYSGKHRRHGMNVQVIVDAAGRLVWAPAAIPGSAHDVTAARTHGIIAALTNADVMTFADKAYQGVGGSVRTRSSGTDTGRSCRAGRRP
jgi:hypothetical protein